MAKSRPLSQLGQDLRAGIELSLEKAAHGIVHELKDRGPYWSGDFEAAWVAEPGQKLIPSPKPEGQYEETPKQRQITPITIQPTTPEKGYTIANEMEYADKAMDLEPGDDGLYRGERPRETSKTGRDWFERFMQGGELYDVLGDAVEDGLRIAGFK